MKHLLKYMVVGILASLLGYILISVWVTNCLLVCGLSIVAALGILFIIRSSIQKYKFNFIFLVSVFFFVLLAPLFGKKETDSLEKRTLSSFPKFDINYIWGFTYGIADYFNDRFAYRNASIAFLGKAKYHLLHESPMPNLVEIGKDTMLFYTPIDYVHEMSEPFTTGQLDSIRTNLEIMTKWFESKGIKYYLTSQPGKEHIYPERMSEGLQKRTEFSRLAQLYNFIKDDTLIRFIDCRKELTDNKKTRLTYLEGDSHWNMFGAYFSYYKTMERMKHDFPFIHVAELHDYRMDSVISIGGDLQRHLGFDDLFTSHVYKLTPKNGAHPVNIDSGKYDSPDAHVQIWENSATDTGNIQSNPLKLFVVHDSYMEVQKALYRTQFRRSFFVWTKTPPVSMIMQEHPDIVLHEALERFLGSLLKLPDEIKNDSAFINHNFPLYYKKVPVN